MAFRVGLGYDIHRKAQGRPLVLGGVTFDGDWGLEGHSDADVLTHAVADALLGALALGDIGRHFPPDQPRWKDASSLEILRLVRALVEGAGGSVVNVDVAVVAEAPRIAPRREAIAANLAQALRVSHDRVSIKATTNEALGALGRGEGIAAWAVALVETTGAE
jgi:2-C-methyl-D-erythritol 2,4-cyclodiphosphate synthase